MTGAHRVVGLSTLPGGLTPSRTPPLRSVLPVSGATGPLQLPKLLREGLPAERHQVLRGQCAIYTGLTALRISAQIWT